jgi:hypothetical protein
MKIKVERNVETSKVMIPEEKDLQKLRLKSLWNALSIPIADKQNGTPLAVLQIYNFDENNYINKIEE